jgi:hypothetical protein
VVDVLNKELVAEAGACIADPHQSILVIRSKTFEGQCSLEDPWYNTKYSLEPYSEALLEKLLSP